MKTSLLLLILFPLLSISQIRDTSTATKDETIQWIEIKLNNYFEGKNNKNCKYRLKIYGSVICYITDCSQWQKNMTDEINERFSGTGLPNQEPSSSDITTDIIDLNNMTDYYLAKNSYNNGYYVQICCDNCCEETNSDKVEHYDCLPQLLLPNMDETMFERLNRALLHLKTILINKEKFLYGKERGKETDAGTNIGTENTVKQPEL